MGLFGVTNPIGPVHYRSRTSKGISADFIFEEVGGQTFGFDIESNQVVIRPNEIKKVNLFLAATANDANFVVKGNRSGENFGTKTPFFINQQGSVVVGGEQTSTSGDTFGSLNVASGNLLMGGTLGKNGQVLTSFGASAGYRDLVNGLNGVVVNSSKINGSTLATALQLNPGKNINLDSSFTGGTAGITINSEIRVKIGLDDSTGRTLDGFRFVGEKESLLHLVVKNLTVTIV